MFPGKTGQQIKPFFGRN